MECPSCGATNLEGKKFCGDCGTPLPMRCTACGAENPPGKKFCADCGAALAIGASAARTKEAIGAKWDEINMTERVWTVPKERMKAHREHKVPLSDAALAIITAMAPLRINGYVFPGTRLNRPVGGSALKQVLRRMHQDVTAHGFRSSFRDFASERTPFPAEIAELSLAHTVGTAVERAYRRSDLFDKRRKLMDAWAGYCATPAADSDEVVPLRRAVQ
jgi:integrase